MKKDYNLGEVQAGGSTGMDAFFAAEPGIVTPTGDAVVKTASKTRIKVGSLQQLSAFTRLSAETLIHRSTQDLWAIKEAEGTYYIERLFNDDGSPIKG